MFFSSVPLSRNVFLLISLGITIFVVSNIFIFDVYRPLALDLAQGNNTGDYRASLYRNDTLGIATRIYVVSLPKREDRRQGMEYLRRSLGLRWTYMEAIDGESPMVKKILRAVQLLRDTRSPNSAFQWPSFVPPLSEYMDPWSPGFLAPEDESDLHIPQPMHMTCATQNVTITPYRPDLPEYKILTPARVACWFSHLSVIQTIANDNTLRADDVVLVLEDDVNMERDIHVRLSKVWRLLPASWDIVYLGAPTRNWDERNSPGNAAAPVVEASMHACLCALAFWRAPRIIAPALPPVRVLTLGRQGAVVAGTERPGEELFGGAERGGTEEGGEE
ncbi:hypothetical protein H0H81_002721 [Sphagnurus paluster]|uniref:Glycosyl transferase family 25 domain-containing protein n=1 Tax=Sphagnurus paluster TaxID=117069 RepID=A0A9P7GMG3_9AGAR|nr:hypothetical protein H0H81_002721 [Sphagnurus paluster]